MYFVDDFPSIQDCVNHVPRGSTIKFKADKIYTIQHVSIKKPLNIDFSGCKINYDNTGGKPGFHFVGSETEPLENIKVYNATVTETGNTGNNPVLSGINSTHIFHFESCNKVDVENVKCKNFRSHAFNFKNCYNTKVKKCEGYDPTNVSAGHGYLLRFEHCSSSLMENCISKGCRHHFDAVGGYDLTSKNNYAEGVTASAYSLHGFGTQGYKSINDKAINCNVGWAIGNPSFSGDYNSIIEKGFYTGNNMAFQITNGSQDVLIDKLTSVSGAIGIHILDGSKRIKIINSNIKVTNDTYGIRSIQTNGQINGDIEIENTNIDCSSNINVPAILINSNGKFSMNNVTVLGGDYMVQIGSSGATEATSETILNNCNLYGNAKTRFGVYFNNRPRGGITVKNYICLGVSNNDFVIV